MTNETLVVKDKIKDVLTINIFVNEQELFFIHRNVTGAEIKERAIAKGVHIEQNFVLQEDRPNGTSQIIGDDDQVHIHDGLKFTAIAPDDNS